MKKFMVVCFVALWLCSGCGRREGSDLTVCTIESETITLEATLKGNGDEVRYVDLRSIHVPYTEDEIDDSQVELIKSLFMKQHGILDEEYVETKVDKKDHKVIVSIKINLQEEGATSFLQTFGFGNGSSTNIKEIVEASKTSGAKCE